jgi:hypothetical protein
MPRLRNGGSTVSGPSSSALVSPMRRRQPRGADQEGTDPCREREIDQVLAPLANPNALRLLQSERALVKRSMTAASAGLERIVRASSVICDPVPPDITPGG